MDERIYNIIENWMSDRGLYKGIDEDILEEAIFALVHQIMFVLEVED